jgi:hypothetical protein
MFFLKELERECLKLCDSGKMQTIYFATTAEATIANLRRRAPDIMHGAKGIKIPKHALHENLVTQVESGKSDLITVKLRILLLL